MCTSIENVSLLEVGHRLSPGLVNRGTGLSQELLLNVTLSHPICLFVNSLNPLVPTCHVQLTAHHRQLLQVFRLLSFLAQCLADFKAVKAMGWPIYRTLPFLQSAAEEGQVIFVKLLGLFPLLRGPIGVLGQSFLLEFVALVAILTVRFKRVLENLEAFLLFNLLHRRGCRFIAVQSPY